MRKCEEFMGHSCEHSCDKTKHNFRALVGGHYSNLEKNAIAQSCNEIKDSDTVTVEGDTDCWKNTKSKYNNGFHINFEENHNVNFVYFWDKYGQQICNKFQTK